MNTTASPIAPATPIAPALVEREAPADPPPEQEVIRCETTADFLAALPRLVGFTATNSLFVVLFSGKRTGGTIRVDLPDAHDPWKVAGYLDELCELIERVRRTHGSSAPAIVISSAETFAETGGIPWRAFARQLKRRLSRDGHRLRELCCIAPDGWVSYLEPNPPRRGHPLSEISGSSVAAQGTPLSLDEVGAFPVPTPEERAAVITALRHGGKATDSGARYATVLLGSAELTPEEVAGVIRAANTEIGWIALFDRLAATAARLRRGMEADELGPEYDDAQQRLRAASERLAKIAGLTPVKLKPNVYACCAIAWWFRGMQSVAHRQITTAMKLDAESDVVKVVRKLVDGSRLPLMVAA